MKLKNSINQFYFDMIINELRLMNNKNLYPNVTYNTLLYLDIIAYKENCTISFIAEAMNVAKSAVTLKINELTNQGLVIKKQSTEDKRINYLSVNQEVIDEYKIYDNALHGAIQAIKNKYSEEEINIFCNMLQVISSYYREESDKSNIEVQ